MSIKSLLNDTYRVGVDGGVHETDGSQALHATGGVDQGHQASSHWGGAAGAEQAEDGPADHHLIPIVRI